MLSNKEIVCPEQLIKLAKTKGPIKVVIVNAGKAVSIAVSYTHLTLPTICSV